MKYALSDFLIMFVLMISEELRAFFMQGGRGYGKSNVRDTIPNFSF